MHIKYEENVKKLCKPNFVLKFLHSGNVDYSCQFWNGFVKYKLLQITVIEELCYSGINKLTSN